MLTKYASIAKILKKTSTPTFRGSTCCLRELVERVQNAKITSLGFSAKNGFPYSSNPDYELVRSLVQKAIDPPKADEQAEADEQADPHDDPVVDPPRRRPRRPTSTSAPDAATELATTQATDGRTEPSCPAANGLVVVDDRRTEPPALPGALSQTTDRCRSLRSILGIRADALRRPADPSDLA